MRVELALSLAGHDKGHYYVVVGEEAEAVYVADGELKLLARPKRKTGDIFSRFENCLQMWQNFCRTKWMMW